MTSEMPSEQKVQWIGGDLLAAVVDDQGQADEAMNALELQGILRDSIRVFHGEVGRYEIEKIGGEGLKGMTLRLIEDWVANAKDLTDRLKDESAGGHYVLIMPLPNSNMEDQVRSILQAHGAHSMAVRINDNWKSYA